MLLEKPVCAAARLWKRQSRSEKSQCTLADRRRAGTIVESAFLRLTGTLAINRSRSNRITQESELDGPGAADTERFVERAPYKRAWERCAAELATAYADLSALNTVVADLKQQLAERVDNEEALRRLAYHDALTGLANRLLLHEYLSHEIVQARRRKTRLAMFFLDLDHFKSINDTFGHVVGDQVLQQVAARLTACVRAGDIVSRHGGDEFVLALVDIGSLAHAVQVARKLLAQVSAPYPINGHGLQMTASVGIALYPDNGRDFDSLMQNADAAMLSVKIDGRNNYQFVTNGTPNLPEHGIEPGARR